MVRTRSKRASEPLERLATPPKRTRKTTKKPMLPVQGVPSPAKGDDTGEAPQEEGPEEPRSETLIVEDVETAVSTPWEQSAFAQGIKCLTIVIEDTPLKRPAPSGTESTAASSAKSSTKRPRDESEDEVASSKRVRRQRSPPRTDPEDMLFMFPKKVSAEQVDEDLANSVPVKSYAEQIRRDRRRREIAKRSNRLGITPRRAKPVRLEGDNPFGIETFSAAERAVHARVRAAQQESRETSEERHQREERSAAPEPETPSRGLFGSLRDLGSAAFSRLGSPFGSFTPRSTTPISATAPQVRTEPRRRPARVWDIEYPEIVSPQDGTSAPANPAQGEETEPEKERKALESNDRKTSRASDSLHTIPIDSNSENLPYPVNKQSENKAEPTPVSEAARAAADARRARRERLHGKPQAQEKPATAPLFGPNSHYARGTINPQYQEFHKPGVHPAFRKYAGDKRTFDETLPEIPMVDDKPASKTYQPYVEDEKETSDATQDEPSTPTTKRQKTSDAAAPQTPRSALKAPGTAGRSGRSARFNHDPVASVKRMSPIYGNAPAGVYPYSPDNLFSTFEDDRQHQRDEDSTMLSDASPRTMNNTAINAGIIQHPGDLLTRAINHKGLNNVQFEWNDPNDPDWKPSLANPRPGHYRLPDFESELGEDDDSELDLSQESVQPETPPQPSTPRMSHAELPKPASTTPQVPPSASALEAANLERRRAEATKTKPRTSSRLAEVISARSRSPSPPALEADEAAEASDASAKTPSPTLANSSSAPTWTWDDETNEYISSSGAYPDFAYNPAKELVPSFCLRTPSGKYDDTVTGPDKMTEAQRQAHYAKIYDDAWAEKEFVFDAPQTYEEAGVGTKYVHELIRKNDSRYPEVVRQCDERFALEWDAHQEAIDQAVSQGKRLVATYPDRDGMEMQDEEL